MRLIHIRHAQNHMATTFEFLLSCPEGEKLHAESVLSECQGLVHTLELELSEFLPESPVHRLNHAAPGVRIPLTAAGAALLQRSLQMRARTEGAFDVTAKSAPSSASGERIGFDPRTGEAWRLDDGARLGFGAIGKGYALDRVRELLEREGFRDYVLSAGGSSLILSGFAGPGDPWDFGWSWKKDETGAPLGLRLRHNGETVAIGVSGTHEKGQHIIRTGNRRPAGAASLQSALVALPSASAADADALSTALFVSGWEKNVALARNVVADCGVPPGMACIEADETPAWNGIFHRLFGAALVGCACILSTLASLPVRADDGDLDLSAMGGNDFTPYILERSPWWALLPAFVLFVVVLHLRKNKPKSRTQERSRV